MTMAESERQRRRPPIACAVCRRRKIKCNKETPCSNCLRSRAASGCVYERLPSAKAARPGRTEKLQDITPRSEIRSTTERWQQIGYTFPLDERLRTDVERAPPVLYSNSTGTNVTTPSNSSEAYTSGNEAEPLKRRIRELEAQLAVITGKSTHITQEAQESIPPQAECVETEASLTLPQRDITIESGLFGQCYFISHSVMHKERLVGQSHWSNFASSFRDIFEYMEIYIRNEPSNKVVDGLRKSKHLARLVKSQRGCTWPTFPTAELPSKHVTDKLIQCYLRTSESIWRVLHVPTFMQEYNNLWIPEAPKPEASFLVQVKLVLAIGAATYDDTFSLRSCAIRWVYEGLTWESEPEFKSRLNTRSLQNIVLLLLARDLTNIGQSTVWISVGTMVRTAIQLGYHRDPSTLPKRSILYTETRRRLWSTILEVALQSSITSGSPPLISTSDFDTQPPRNFDDEQLMADNPSPRPDDQFTSVSALIVLGKTLPLRLMVIKYLNSLNAMPSFEDVLRLDSELRIAHKALRSNWRGLTPSAEAKSGPSKFETAVLDVVMLHYITSLHSPFMGLAITKSAYAHSRMVLVETSLKIIHILHSWFVASTNGSPAYSDVHCTMSGAPDDLTRLSVCANGLYRLVAWKASFIIAVELKSQMQEDSENMGLSIVRPDLLGVLEHAKSWTLKSIEAGDTNIKNHLSLCLIAAQIDGLRQGLGNQEQAEKLGQAAIAAGERCLKLLERQVRSIGLADSTMDELDQMSLDSTPGFVENWGFIMSNSQFNMGNGDMMSWVFGDPSLQDGSPWC